jgi:hypothetical protein
MNRQILFLFLGFVALWDAVTTIIGTVSILGNSAIQIFISILFGVIISMLLINTIPIVNNPREDFLSTGAKFLWFLALLYDIYTAYSGNKDYITHGAITTGQTIITIGLTIFVASAPIFISWVLYGDTSSV